MRLNVRWRLRGYCLTCAAMALAGGAASPALAQDVPTQPDRVEARTGERFDEIVVTAQKRAENLQQVPAAISAFSGESLQNYGVSQVPKIASLVPNLQVYSPYGEGSAPVFTMRGVSANDYSLHNSRPIAVYFDESVRGLSVFEVQPFFDMERIEVLRGPQGTLYGRNATAGAILAISKKPVHTSEGYLTLGYGNFDRKHAEGALNIPLGQTVAARIAATYTKDDGFIKSKFPGNPNPQQTDLFAVRGSLLFEPHDGLEMVLRGYHVRSKGESYAVIARNIDPNFLPPDVRSDLGFFETRGNRRAERDIKNSGVNLHLTAQLSDSYAMTLIASYDTAHYLIPNDDDGLQVSLIDNDPNVRNVKQYYGEARVSSDLDGRFNWLAGVNYFRDRADVDNELRFFNDPVFYTPGSGFQNMGPAFLGSPFNERNSFTQKRQGYAGFLRATYEVTDSLSFTGGVRYSHDRLDVSDYGGCATIRPVRIGDPDFYEFCSFDPPPSESLTIFSFSGVAKKKSYDNVSVEAVVNYQASDDILIYASYKEGYRTGAVNGQAMVSAALVELIEPEDLRSYEVGLKSQLFDRRLQFNLVGFYYDVSNLQSYKFIAGAQVSGNVDARIYGIEAEARVIFSDWLRLSSSLGVQDPKYDSLLLGFPTKGQQLIGASKLNLNVAADATLSENSAGTVDLHLDASYRSRQYFDAVNSRAFSQAGYWLANARLTFSPENKGYSVALFGNNLFNKQYTPYGFASRADFGYDIFMPGEGRSYGVEATIRF